MKKLCALVLTLCLLCFSGCSESGYSKGRISEIIGIDISGADYMTTIDIHGGFHGDGNAHVIIPLEGTDVLEQIQTNPAWHAFPLTENLTAIVYGLRTENASTGPYISFDDSGNSSIPEITDGYYFFLDRHSQCTDPHDDTNVLSRASFNLTIAIFDCHTETLHYLELDT